MFFVFQVTVVEALDRIGGRIRDDFSLGSVVGLGSQIITGCINNPLYVMCEQVRVFFFVFFFCVWQFRRGSCVCCMT